MTTSYEIRQLAPADIDLMWQIDRSEHIKTEYEVREGVLTSKAVDIHVPSWDPVGSGGHSVSRRVDEFLPVLEGEGRLLGAFVGEELAGLAIVDPSYETGVAWLAFLHVSRAHRRRGVASLLWDASEEIASDAGATTMYVSATPSGSAVGFYTSRGCRVAESPIPELYAKEPEDIHLVCPLA